MEDYVHAAGKDVSFMSAEDLARVTWDLPLGDKVGYMRGVCRGIRGVKSALEIAIVPVGQKCPEHSAGAEHLFLGLRGSVTFKVAGTEYRLGPNDLLYIAAGVMYEFWNSGFEPAHYVNASGMTADDWPTVGIYPGLELDSNNVWQLK